jgi:broad specificity phosphatase PhoE
LAKEKIDHFYASDLGRAVETAKIIAKDHNKPVQTLDLLRETKFGVWEGLNYDEIQQKYPELWLKWRDNPRTTLLPEGEALDDVAERVMKGIKQIVDKHQDETVAVITHGGTIRLILSKILDMDITYIWRIRQDNVALNVIDFYGKRVIVALVNDTNHLASGLPK